MRNQIFKKINYQKLRKIAAIFNFFTISVFEICINIFLFVKCINIVSIVTRDIATLKQMMFFFTSQLLHYNLVVAASC